jgi:hypothetical protein
MRAGRYQVRFEPGSRPGTVQIAWRREKQMFLTVDGAWKGGIEQMRFEGSLLGAPLTVRITIDRSAAENDLRFAVDTPFEFAAWRGQDVSKLPWFDELYDLIGTFTAGGEVTMTCFVEGQRAGTGVLNFLDSDANRILFGGLQLLACTRSLAEHYAKELRLPSPLQISYAQERVINALWALTSGNSFVEDIPGASFECIVSSITPSAKRLLGARRRKHHGSVQIFGTSAFDILGTVVEVNNLENIFSDVELTEVERISSTSRRLRFVGSNRAKWLRRVRVNLN